MRSKTRAIELEPSKQMKEPISMDISLDLAASIGTPSDHIFQNCLSLVLALERSLQSSQTALLALDAAGTEECITEQSALCGALRTVTTNSVSPAVSMPGKTFEQPWFEQPVPDRQVQDELCAAARRVQHLARVQGGLLRRSQQFLCVLANWMTGTAAFYGPPPSAGSFRECPR